eukprot:SM000024S07859  [mRNA]  locus=s24:1065588:1068119:+ [translate_table: standard]
MAANFWTSSHCKQLLDRDDLRGRLHPQDQALGLTPEDVRLVKINMAQCIKVLAQQAKVRQRVVATAIVYFRRVYYRKSFADYDPRLVAPSCLYLASKAEESCVQAKVLVFYMKKLWPAPEDRGYQYESKDILEMEMKLLECLDYYLVVYHPYRPALQYLTDAGLVDLVQVTLSLINDTYKTDLPLVYAPYLIAISCMYLACTFRNRDTRTWFEDLRIDMNHIYAIILEMLDFYEKYRVIDEERVNNALSKLPERPST